MPFSSRGLLEEPADARCTSALAQSEAGAPPPAPTAVWPAADPGHLRQAHGGNSVLRRG